MPTAIRADTAVAFDGPASHAPTGISGLAARETAAPRTAPPPAPQAEGAAPNLYEQVLAELFAADSYLHRRKRPAGSAGPAKP